MSLGRARNIEAIYPLTPMQEGMLFHSKLGQGSDIYFGQITASLDGKLDVPAFVRAWQEIIDRHSILRTAFTTVRRGKPMQIVNRSATISVDQLDWRQMSCEEQNTELQRFLSADCKRGLDLSKAPLMRLTLARLSEESYRFIWSHHHLVIDGWSVPLVLNDLLRLYDGHETGAAVQLPTPRSYADYVGWLAKQDIKEAERYWRNLLSGFRVPTVLRIERTRTERPVDGGRVENDNIGEQTIEVSPVALTHLSAIGRVGRFTLNTIVQAAWAILLGHYSGEVDVVYGTTVSGRPAEMEGVEEIVGMFINTLPMRISVRPENRLQELLKQIQEQQLEMRQYEYSPLVEVQGWSQVEQGLPLFNAIFVFQNYPTTNAPTTSGALSIQDVSAVERSNYPLGIVAGLGDTLTLKASYSRERFGDDAILRLLGHFRNILESIAQDPKRLVGEVEMLSHHERREIVDLWNETGAAYPRERTVVDLFEVQAAQGGARLAIQCESEQCSYEELSRRTNQLARYLQEKGVGPEQIVGICVDRGPMLATGLLGILKAGGAYLPLDADYPRVRMDYMLQDSEARVVISQSNYRDRFSETAQNVILLDREWAEISRRSAEPVDGRVDGRNLAYVIYTSGSSGHPKGVAVTHGNIVHLVSQSTYSDLQHNRRMAQASNSSFDALTFELWGALANGQCLSLMTRDSLLGSTIGKCLAERQIDSLFLTTALFNQIAREAPDSFQSLGDLLFGGEAVNAECVRQVMQANRPHRLTHVYGPTECTTFSSYYPVGGVEQDAKTISIGRPIANVRMYVLDGQMRPVPVEVPGELYIGGAGLARGYLCRPALTAAKFLPDPFAREPGARVYRSGDQVRFLPDGNIEFLGRMDYQVKVRGFRIEPEEIEAALVKHPDVSEAAVALRESPTAGKQLVAFVVPRANAALEMTDLASWLKTQMPSYMIPALFVSRKSIPLNANGKMDRNALEVDTEFAGSPSEPKGALSPVEEVLVGIWRELLGVDHVGINDDFFELGGHSLLAMRAVSRVAEVFQVQLPLSTILESATIAELAVHIESRIGQPTEVAMPRFASVPREGKIPLSFAQQRLWFVNQLEFGNAAYNMHPTFRLRGSLQVSTLERCINELIARHESLRTIFTDSDGEPAQVVLPDLHLTMKVINIEATLEATEESERLTKTREIINREARTQFDLARGPLVRPTLVRLSEFDHILLLAMHHIVSDGHSLGILFEELSELYRAYSMGGTCSLPDQPLQYADYSAWQRTSLQGETLDRLLAYWKKELADAPTALVCSRARMRPPSRSFEGKIYSWMMPADLSRDVDRLGHHEGTTKFMTLLAAFYVLLRHHAVQDDIMVGTDIACRTRPEVERMTGFFINQLALRGNLSGNPTFREFLTRVRRTALGAYAHQELPFEKLVDSLLLPRHLNRAPLFQVKLLFQPSLPGVLRLPGIEAEPFEVETGTSALDLLCALLETPEGLLGTLEYDTDILDQATMVRMAEDFEAVLRQIVAQPNSTLDELEAKLSAMDRERHPPKALISELGSLSKLRSIRPKPIPVEHQQLVRVVAPAEAQSLPLALQPDAQGVDLAGWLAANRLFIANKLLEHGALSFQGFDINSTAEFERVAAAVCSNLVNDNGEHPRESQGGNIFSPVFYPATEKLLWHNENSFNHTWPGKILFCCVQAPLRGGETPLVDSRKVFDNIPPKVRERFLEKGVMYVRNYSRGLGLDWQTVFQTTDRHQVEAQCNKNLMQVEWKPDGDLRTRAVRPAALKHPKNGAWSWFNQAQHWHLSCLDPSTRDSIVSLFRQEDYPRGCYYGDGSPIADEDMAEILNVYRSFEVVQPWRRGDILLLDNLLTAHARNAYVGTRKLLVALGDLGSYGDSLEAGPLLPAVTKAARTA